MRTDLWSEDEVKFIIKNYGTMSLAEMTRTLGRSAAAIKTKMSRLCIIPKRKTPWTRDEELFLEQNADKMTGKEIAAFLGRTHISVFSKGASMGISFCSVRKRYSDEDVALCRALHAEGLPMKVIAEKMEIPFNTLKCFIYKSHKGYRNIQPAQ